MRLGQGLAVVLALGLAACARTSEVAEIGPGILGVTAYGQTSAIAARTGVERARAHCAAQQQDFEVVRSAIGRGEYQIAFRCLRPRPAEVTPAA